MINSYLYPGGEAFLGDEIKKSHFSSKELSYSAYPGAYVLPFRQLENGKTGGGVVTGEGDYISSSGVHNGFCCQYTYDVNEAELCTENVIYLGMFNGAWGHCLTDNIRRLWFVNTEDYRENYSECKIVYTALDTFRFSDSFIKLLSILGVEAEKLEKIDNVTVYKNIIIPDESFYADDAGFRFFTKEYVNLIDMVKSYAANVIPSQNLPANIDKIFLTYSQFSKGKTSGEDMLAEFFADNGFTLIAPEKYSFDDQIYIYTHCSVMASTVGSCSHNSIFLSDGAEMILIPRSYYLTGYQAALNELNKINITLVDSSLSDRVNSGYPWGGPFCFFVSNELESLFNKKIVETQSRKAAFHTLKNYYKTAMQCERMFPMAEITPPEYYEKAVQGYTREMFSTLGIGDRFSRLIMKTLRLFNNIYVRFKNFIDR